VNRRDLCACQNVMKAVHCYKPVERRCKLVQLLASMCTYDVLYETTTHTAADVRVITHTDSTNVV